MLSYRSPWFVMGDILDVYNTYIRDFFQTLDTFVKCKTSNIPVRKSGPQLDMELKLNWETVTVFILLIILVAVIGGRFYAFAQLENIHTVDHIATNGKTICVHHNSTLLLLSADGVLQESIPLSELHLHSSPSDVELLSDGSLLIGDSGTDSILKCDIVKKYCNEIAPSSGIKINDNFKFIANERDNILYISDTNNHRLIKHDLKTGKSDILRDIKLKYPNDLAISSAGLLQIADTKNTRIVSVDSGENPERTGTEKFAYLVDLGIYPEPKSTYKNPEAITEKVVAGAVSNYPSPLAMVQAADLKWWVIVSDAYINYGELWVFDVSGAELVKKVSLSDRSIPLDIIRLNDRILVTDTEENQVYSMNTAATRIEPFGDKNFQKILMDIRKKRDFYRAIKNHSFKVLGILLIAFLLMLFMIKRKQKTT